MRIVLSSGAYAPSRGGAEQHSRELAGLFRARGHDVVVVTSNLERSAGFYTLDSPVSQGSDHVDGTPVVRVPYYDSREARLLASLGSLTGPLGIVAAKAAKLVLRVRFARRTRAAIRAARPEVVVALPHAQPNVVASTRAARRLRIPYAVLPLLHPHDPDWPRAAVRRITGAAAVVFAVTRVEQEALIADYAVERDRAVFAGVGVRRGAPAAHAHGRTFLFLGRRTASKGLALLGEAAAILASSRDDFAVAVVGSSAPDTDQAMRVLRQALPPAMLLEASDVTDAERDGRLASCLALVLPSEVESFGLVLLESWAAGRPVIALDLPVFREIVQSGRQGLLVPPRDPRALAAAMTRLLDDPAAATAMGAAGRERAEQVYHWDAVADRMLAALSRAVTG